MNADYVPGILSILHGDDLEDLGLRTLWEALALVPGFESTTNNFGNPLAIARGIGYDVLTSHLKLFVDSVPVNLSFTGANHAVMTLPVSQIERVEVIRGPGAALHGEFAFAGVINVITRQDRRRLSASGGRFRTVEAAGHYFLARPEDKLRVDVGIAYLDTDGADVLLQEDAVRRTQPAVSLTPGPANEDEEHRSVVASLEYRGLEVRLQDLRRRNGLYFGTRSRQPDPDAKDQADGYFAADVRYRFSVHRRIELQARAAMNDGNRTFKEHVLPPGATMRFATPPGQPQGPVIPLPLGLPFLSYHRERRWDAGLDARWSPSKRHTVLVRASRGDIEIVDTRQESTVAVLTGRPLGSYRELGPGESGAVPPGSGRTVTSLGVQHQLEISDRLTSTLGARYDDLSDVGTRFHPRFALVLRLGDPHILKAQYAEAFRPPSLQALNLPAFTSFLQRGNPEIKPETIRTAEVGYVYRRPRVTLRATVFRSDADDLIGSVAGRSENITHFHYEGAEVEIDWRFRGWLRVLANASAFEATDEKAVRGLEGAADRMFNVVVFGQPRRDVQLNARVHGVGRRTRNLTDMRPPLGGHTALDLGLKWAGVLGASGLQLRGGLKNALDADVRTPAQGNSYLDDLPRPGRVWWLGARWER